MYFATRKVKLSELLFCNLKISTHSMGWILTRIGSMGNESCGSCRCPSLARLLHCYWIGITTILAGELLFFWGETGFRSSSKCSIQELSYYIQSKMSLLRWCITALICLLHEWKNDSIWWMWKTLSPVIFIKQLYFFNWQKYFVNPFFLFFSETSSSSSIVKWNVLNFQNKRRKKQEIFYLKILKVTLPPCLHYSDSISKYPPNSAGTQVVQLLKIAFFSE